jgi:hypothetical protein
LTQTLPDDFAEAMSASEAFAAGVGGVLVADFLAGAEFVLAAGAEAGAAAGAGADFVAAGAGVGAGAVAAGAAGFADDALEEGALDGVALEEAALDAGADEAAVLDFLLLREEVFAVEESAAGAEEASLGAAASAALDFFDDFLVEAVSLLVEASVLAEAVLLLVEAEPLDALPLSAAVSDFFDFRVDFLVVVESDAAAVELSLASAAAFLDFLVFLVVVVVVEL